MDPYCRLRPGIRTSRRSAAFGVLNDAALWLLRDVNATTYWQQWLLAACGIVIVCIGVAL